MKFLVFLTFLILTSCINQDIINPTYEDYLSKYFLNKTLIPEYTAFLYDRNSVVKVIGSNSGKILDSDLIFTISKGDTILYKIKEKFSNYKSLEYPKFNVYNIEYNVDLTFYLVLKNIILIDNTVYKNIELKQIKYFSSF